MNTLIDLDGTTAARGLAQDGETPVLTLFAASGFSDKGYYPAESVTVAGLEAIADLRALCEGLIEAHAEQTQVVLPPVSDPELGQRL